jgi:hypothetical protein
VHPKYVLHFFFNVTNKVYDLNDSKYSIPSSGFYRIMMLSCLLLNQLKKSRGSQEVIVSIVSAYGLNGPGFRS